MRCSNLPKLALFLWLTFSEKTKYSTFRQPNSRVPLFILRKEKGIVDDDFVMNLPFLQQMALFMLFAYADAFLFGWLNDENFLKMYPYDVWIHHLL